MLLLMLPVILWGQEDGGNTGLRFHHIGFMLGGALVEEVPFGDDTVNFEFELSAAINEHIFKGSVMIGTLSNLFDGIGNYNEYNLLYGRELQLNEHIYFDAYGGVGYFQFLNYDVTENDRTKLDQTIGIPLEACLRFPIWNWFSIGAKVHHNFNSIAQATAIGLQLQYRFE